jgi:hypothetical protein
VGVIIVIFFHPPLIPLPSREEKHIGIDLIFKSPIAPPSLTKLPSLVKEEIKGGLSKQ